MRIFYITALVVIHVFGFSQQDLLSKISLSKQVGLSEIITEGEVVAKKSYWDEGKKNIYTVHTIEVSKSYKGEAKEKMHIVSLGGTVGLKAMTARPSLQLAIGTTGVFMAKTFAISLEGFTPNAPLYRSVGSSQGFYKYDTESSTATNPFTQFSSLKSLDDSIISITGEETKQLKETNYLTPKKKSVAYFQESNTFSTAAINSISPTEIVAGNKSVLTISGLDFGTDLGTVRFKDADDAGASTIDALETQIVSWTDSEIQVEVPGKAGTGAIEVETESGVKSQFSGLVVTHAFIAIKHTDGDNNVQNGKETEYTPHHISSAVNSEGNASGNFDDDGAYIFSYHTDFKNNIAAVASFEDGFDPIVCNAGINFKISPDTTSSKSEDDNINSISFVDDLDEGVLGQALSRFSGYFENCYSINSEITCDDIYWITYEVDYFFNENFSWDFDLDGETTSSEIDFNAVVRHETGHASGLGHVIDTQKIMHYALSRGPNQDLLSNTMYAPIQSKLTNDRSTTPPISGVLTPNISECYTLSTGELVDNVFKIYPNPASNILNVSSEKPILKITVYSLLGSVANATETKGLGTSNVELNIQNLSSGVYIIVVETDLGRQILKCIKE